MGTRNLSSYDPRMIEILIRAANQFPTPLEIECKEPRLVYTLKFRLMQIKSLMQKENHPAYTTISKVAFSSSKTSSKLVLRQNDSDLNDILTETFSNLKTGPSPEPDAPNLDFGDENG